MYSMVMIAIGFVVLGLAIAIMVKGKGCNVNSLKMWNYGTLATGLVLTGLPIINMVREMKGSAVNKPLGMMIGIYTLVMGLWVTFLGVWTYRVSTSPVTPGGACSKVKDEAYGLMVCGVVMVIMGGWVTFKARNESGVNMNSMFM